MKKFLLIFVLLLNLQVITSCDGVSVGLSCLYAQTFGNEYLDNINIDGSSVQCVRCGERYFPGEEQLHDSECSMKLVTCDQCGRDVLRKDLSDHGCVPLDGTVGTDECPFCHRTLYNGEACTCSGWISSNSDGGGCSHPSGPSYGGGYGGGGGSGKYEYEVCKINYGEIKSYDHKRLECYDLVVLNKNDFQTTLKNVCALMSTRTSKTGKEIAAIQLKGGNFVIFHDKNNTETSSYVKHDALSSNTYNGEKIVNFYHTHPNRGSDKLNPLDISDSDVETANKLKVIKIHIIYPDGRLYYVYKDALDKVY